MSLRFEPKLSLTNTQGVSPVKTPTTRSIAFRASILASALALVACGGGDDAPACVNINNPAACVFLAPTGGGNTGGPLFTTAPSAVTLDAGSNATYQLSGGDGHFTATSGNTSVVKPTVSGNVLSLAAVAPGTTQVSVVDTIGERINLSVTVLAQGSSGTPLSLTPGNLTIGNCTTRVPFMFTGGSAPYTVFTSDNFNVPVSSALDLPDGRHYFFADIRYFDLPFPIPRESTATLTVLDSQSRSAAATVLTPLLLFKPCIPPTPLLKVMPESANFRASEILAFKVTGGVGTHELEVSFFDANVAKVVPNTISAINGETIVTVQAADSVPPAGKSTLMTILNETDGQRVTVVVNVLPQPKPAF